MHWKEGDCPIAQTIETTVTRSCKYGRVCKNHKRKITNTKKAIFGCGFKGICEREDKNKFEQCKKTYKIQISQVEDKFFLPSKPVRTETPKIMHKPNSFERVYWRPE